MSKGNKHVSHARIWILVAALFVRALIPLGYMPGNLLAGEYMVLCSFQAPMPSGHGHHEHDADTADEAHDACPIGQAVQQVALPPVPVAAIEPAVPHDSVVPVDAVVHITASVRIRPIRGPPQFPLA